MRAALALALLLGAGGALAGKVYKYVDADGIVHYTDRKPADDIHADVISVRAEVQDIVALRLDGDGARRRATVANRIAGPVEVELAFTSRDNIVAAPPLPLRAVVPGESERGVATFDSADKRRPASLALQMRAVPGDPSARPQDVDYVLPVAGTGWRIDQGFGGDFSHGECASRYAIDIAVDEGTPVLAARAGVVMQVEDEFEGAGLDLEKFGARANHVRILHDDGSMAVYAHLQPDSVLVRPGRRVAVGHHLGASGNTGYSTGPHLHFAVQVNAGMALEAVPFLLVDAAGALVEIPGATRETRGEASGRK
ncbi:peptidoglycan DD-metalloendopeptidase family protein [Chiayiivirga flava]|uniref:Murein DD-endopeptidase MepM/ murein hydrolase activator NlpD n=1 Tax=Chiayiivirga flava TaxID=659595 RepID=A0A7W8G2M3_9GAMM|nr:murein DD-endopeptidase MepM/ murein hydrolase activator NlpD [Chiayiivirga flava]